MLATEKSTKGGEIQVAILLTLLGPQGQEIFRTFNPPEEDPKDIEKVKEAFTRHFTPQVKTIYEWYKFHNRTQLPGESFNNFLTALRGLLSTCNIHADEQNSALIDRIVCGINSPEDREDKFNVDGNPDLNKVIQLCRRAEATKHYLTDMKINKENANINTVKQPTHLAYKNKNGVRVNNCKYCKSSHPKGACPAYGKECRNCHKMNHLSIACMAPQRKSAAKAAYELVETSGEQNDITFTVNNNKSGREWCITARCNEKPLHLKVDTRASCNVMPKGIFDSLLVHTSLQKYGKSIVSFSNHELDVLGKVTLLVDVSSRFVPLDFVIVSSSAGQKTLLGLPSAME
ncbi:uncharacterized protein [Watersipora subatra]|uniref:uncharacterized protein n=1 Tax=Watersipora subatra TaxID=2589382 RepID=UPI00355B17DB